MDTTKKIITGLLATTTLATGVFVADPNIQEVKWAYSQSVPDWQTESGDLEIGQYGYTTDGQLFFNADGRLRSFDEYRSEFELKEVLALEEIKFKGERYEDVFVDGVKEKVTALDYEQLKSKTREPLRTKLRLGREAEAAISITATSSTHTSYVNSVTYALNCTGATNSGVLVFISNRTLGDITGVTYNSDAMINDVQALNNNVVGHEVWSRTAADIGNYNVVISNSQFRLHTTYAICLSGTDQTALVEATTSVATGFSTAVTGVATSSTDGAWIFSGLNTQGTRTIAPDSGETELYDSDNSDGNLGQTGVSYFEKATAGAETLGWSWTTNDNYAMMLAVAKPSVDGGGGSTSTPQSEFWFD